MTVKAVRIAIRTVMRTAIRTVMRTVNAARSILYTITIKVFI